MHGTPTGSQAAPTDSSRSALEFIHRLLATPTTAQTDLAGLLSELAAAFAAPAAGLATLPDGVPVGVHPAPAKPSLAEISVPWQDDPDLIDQTRREGIFAPASGRYLLTALGTPESGAWLLWLEDASRAEWTEEEAAALLLVGQTFARRLTTDNAPRWATQLDRAIRQQRLEAAASVVRRLAHDFGNVLTGILGFSELALAQQFSPGTALHAYLTEVHRGAQNGAQYTNQLRLFARRQTSAGRSCSVPSVLAEEEARLRSSAGSDIHLRIELSPDLPAAALDAESLRQVMAVLLDNAREAIPRAGTITVSARSVEVRPAEARSLLGSVRPGAHVEITVADSGSGLTPEVRRQLFLEPFFTTRPRKRGFGLAIAYGILAAHRGGLDLLPQAQGGTVARVLVPAAAVPVPASPRPPDPAQPASPRNEKVLVVDDDPMILQFVTTTLQRAGHRVQAVANAEDALRAYVEAAEDPFHLVLSDVLMPNISGVELAMRLLAQDANVRVLFMSGQVPVEFTQQTFSPGQFDLLAKPFRPEGLVRAVRTALDRVVPRRGLQMTR